MYATLSFTFPVKDVHPDVIENIMQDHMEDMVKGLCTLLYIENITPVGTDALSCVAHKIEFED